MKKLFNVTLLALATSAIIHTSAHASLSNEMDSAFNSMVNTTDAKAYNTSRRGVISGGQIFAKNEIKHLQVANLDLPSASAGCGGIDLYGGSFSFINADQMIETFQAIGSNALGYGVKLAIQSACTSCENVMTSLEKTAQFINKMNVDSCTAAQGIVEAGKDMAIGLMSDASAKNQSTADGTSTDANDAQSKANETGKSPANLVKETNPSVYNKKFEGNVTWRALKKSGNLDQAFTSDDNEILQLVMSIIGTGIVTNSSTEDDSEPTPQMLSGYKVTISDLVNGGDIKVYSCDTTTEDGCKNVSSSPDKVINDEGMLSRVKESLTGSNGVIAALNNNTEWSAEAKKVLNLSSGVGDICLQEIINTAGTDNQGMAEQLAVLCSGRIAIDATYEMINGYFRIVRDAIVNAEKDTILSSAKESVLSALDESRRQYSEEYRQLLEQKATNTQSIVDMIRLSRESKRSNVTTIVGE